MELIQTHSTNGFAFVNDRSVSRVHHVKQMQQLHVSAQKKLRTIVIIMTAAAGSKMDNLLTLEVGSTMQQQMFTIVVTAEDPENEDITAAGCNVKVVMAAASSWIYTAI